MKIITKDFKVQELRSLECWEEIADDCARLNRKYNGFRKECRIKIVCFNLWVNEEYIGVVLAGKDEALDEIRAVLRDKCGKSFHGLEYDWQKGYTGKALFGCAPQKPLNEIANVVKLVSKALEGESYWSYYLKVDAFSDRDYVYDPLCSLDLGPIEYYGSCHECFEEVHEVVRAALNEIADEDKGSDFSALFSEADNACEIIVSKRVKKNKEADAN